jgi:hypothetical protein
MKFSDKILGFLNFIFIGKKVEEKNDFQFSDSFAYNYICKYRIGETVKVSKIALVPKRYQGRKGIISLINHNPNHKRYGLMIHDRKSLLWVYEYELERVK